MKPSSAFTQMGTTARACLASGQRGKILAVFSKTIYLLTEAGELFWITTEGAPLHQRCAQTALPLPGLAAGLSFHVQGHCLIIDPAFVVDIEDAAEWCAPRGDRILEVTSLSARLQTFFSNLDVSRAAGFGIFIPYILSLTSGLSIDPWPEPADPIRLFAEPLILDMTRACLKRQSARISQNTEALIGLGAGLTPSGDDFLGGMLFALKILQAAYPDSAFTDYAIPIESYRLRTHIISFTLLKDLTNGQAIAPLHFIINGLLGGEALERISPSVSQLTQVGHSTGWDLLTGLLVGLLTTYQSNYFIPSVQIHPSLQQVYRS
jgi:hypothetical protein